MIIQIAFNEPFLDHLFHFGALPDVMITRVTEGTATASRIVFRSHDRFVTQSGWQSPIGPNSVSQVGYSVHKCRD